LNLSGSFDKIIFAVPFILLTRIPGMAVGSSMSFETEYPLRRPGRSLLFAILKEVCFSVILDVAFFTSV